MIRDDQHALARRIGSATRCSSSPSAGGGGKGMRMVRTPRGAGVGDQDLPLRGEVRVQRRLPLPREVARGQPPRRGQVAVDRFGAGVHLGERDCSVQRRLRRSSRRAHPGPQPGRAGRPLRAGRSGRRLGRLRERGHARVPRRRHGGTFYFIEINCRIQVEHPVTEMLTGIDLVALQIRIAAGEPLGLRQSDIEPRGHAIEFRINAEDPAHDFRPGAGVIEATTPRAGRASGWTRISTRATRSRRSTTRCSASSSSGPDRATAIARGRAALEELLVDGVTPNVEIHRALLESETFLEGRMTTNLLDRVGGARHSSPRRPP